MEESPLLAIVLLGSLSSSFLDQILCLFVSNPKNYEKSNLNIKALLLFLSPELDKAVFDQEMPEEETCMGKPLLAVGDRSATSTKRSLMKVPLHMKTRGDKLIIFSMLF